MQKCYTQKNTNILTYIHSSMHIHKTSFYVKKIHIHTYKFNLHFKIYTYINVLSTEQTRPINKQKYKHIICTQKSTKIHM